MFIKSLALASCVTFGVVISSSAGVFMPVLPVSIVAADDAPKAEVDPRWLMRLDKEDRAFLDELVGYAPPAFTDDLKWVGMEPATWEELKGRVIVIQTWNTKHGAARTWPARAARATEDWRDRDAVVLALHTPDGADDAEKFLERREQDVPVLIDAKGAFCDALGAYKTPVNVLVDRAGTVRYVGLDEDGLKAAVSVLVEEKASDLPTPKVRETAAEAPSGPRPEFPPITGQVSHATDIRGKRAPDFYVQEWLTKRPEMEGKVVILDFWATWCGPCIAAAPHMSEIQQTFANDVVVIGISDEQKDKFVQEFQKKNLRSKMNYTLALDPSRRMKDAIKNNAIPHVLVISSDWIVRWQGNPHAGLTMDVMKQIVAANSGGAKANPRLRWTGKR